MFCGAHAPLRAPIGALANRREYENTEGTRTGIRSVGSRRERRELHVKTRALRGIISVARDRHDTSLQFNFAAIESHDLIDIRDAKLMHSRAVVLPNIDGIFTFGGESAVGHIRCITDLK